MPMSPAALADLEAKFIAEKEIMELEVRQQEEARLELISGDPTSIVEASPTGATQPLKEKVPVWLAPPPKSPPFARRKPIAQGSAPSSLARNTSPTLSPSKRAEKDEMRIKARVAKRWGSPGPGQYNPQKLGSGILQLAGSSAFRSKSQRPKVDPFLQESQDPGSYNLTDVGSQASSSFNRLNAIGHGAFGSSTERTLKLDVRDSTPGAADYSPLVPRPMASTAADYDAAGGAFRSESPQRPRKLLPSASPGVGAYDPNMTSVEPHIQSGGILMGTGHEARFPSDSLGGSGRETGPGVGPGSYDDKSGTIAQTAAQIHARMSLCRPAFGGKWKARELPFERVGMMDYMSTPGPGAYEARSPSQLSNGGDGHRSSFKTTTIRLRCEAPNGDPGAYDLSRVKTISSDMGRSFNTRSQFGLYAFGPASAREMPRQIMGLDVPAPGTYIRFWTTDFLDGAMGSRLAMPSRSFRSESLQRPMLLPSASPGVGAYDPNMTSVEPHIQSGGILMGTGHEARFPSDSLGGSGRETGPGIGPGSYDAEVNGSIAQAVNNVVDSMSRAIASKEAGFGVGASARPLDLSFVREKKEAPGPGAYFGHRLPTDLAVRAAAAFSTFNASARAGMGAFGSMTARECRSDGRNMLATDAGDPGAYDPRVMKSGDGHEVIQQAAASFHLASRAGFAGFGAQTARVMRQDIMGAGNPGPSEYTPTVDQFGRQRPMGHEANRCRASSALRATSEQRPMLLPSASPGVGAYDPNMTSVEPHIQSGGILMGTGHEARFPSDSLGGSGRETGPGVGPGSYDPERQKDGERATIAMSVADRANQGWSWSVISDNVRTWITDFFTVEIGHALQF